MLCNLGLSGVPFVGADIGGFAGNRLLPYLYSLFWSAANTGELILRPMFHHYFKDSQTYKLYDQVLLGSSLMAAPIYRPGVECRSVYFPIGTWYDWWTGESCIGKGYVLAHAPLERMRIYIFAFFLEEHVGGLSVDKIRFLVAPGMGEFILYELMARLVHIAKVFM